MQILNKNASIRSDICYRITSNGKIADVNKESVARTISVFEELKQEDKSISNIDDLNIASRRSRENHLRRIKTMENEQKIQRNAGYALISGLTLTGTIMLCIIIFTIIKIIVLR